ncbi:DUF4238 domain-containing protein [Spiroplasma endosymbiont of Diplazon laetatorius]|uniref:DUF4238 domain-containing protein n=1 Tax=Spiroplasma endosymbiont of Diplazon laetatorius TaxID=3066322 RepID=UPI0030CD5CE7
MHQNNHYIQKAFIKEYFNSTNLFEYNHNKIVSKNVKNIFTENKLYLKTNGDNSLEIMFDKYIENEGIKLIRKIGNKEWNGEITRLESYKIRKYFLIHFLRHPIWLEKERIDKDSWIEMIKKVIEIDVASLIKKVDIDLFHLEEEDYYIFWFIKGSIMQFCDLEKENDFLLPANLCNQNCIDWTKKNNSLASEVLKVNPQDYISIYGMVSNKRLIVLSSTILVTLINKLLLDNINGIDKNNSLSINIPGIDQMIGFETPEIKHKNNNFKKSSNYSIIGSNDNNFRRNFTEYDEEDIFKYRIIKLNRKNNWIYKINMYKTFSYEPFIFKDLISQLSDLEYIEKSFNEIKSLKEYFGNSENDFIKKVKDEKFEHKFFIWKNIPDDSFRELMFFKEKIIEMINNKSK